MMLRRSTRALTTTTSATRPPSPAPTAKFSRKRLEKEKAPQGRLFDSFALSARKALTAYSHSIVNCPKKAFYINEKASDNI